MKYNIYCIKNEINGKIYIGYTSKTINERFNTHKKNAKKKINRRLYDAMNKYGCENFTIYEIDEVFDIQSAQEIESWYIYIFGSNKSKYGYNMTYGGDGGYTLSKWTDDDKKKLYDHQKIKREDTFMERYGVKTPTQLDWVKKKISNAHKSKTISENHKNSISKTIKEKIKKGEFIPNTSGLKKGHIVGKFNHSNKTKERLSKFRLGKKYEDVMNTDTVIRLKETHRNMFIGKNNPLYVENLNINDQKQFIKFLIENKTIGHCENFFNKSSYKLRQLLREYGIDNIQKLKRTDKENILLNKILKKL
jgi:group I intron endonuclease